ncbi:TRAP transporter small permease subunit [Pseudooceanicola sp. 216_PA32_1]|uniref:TRAP transporter small permease protein n=1 Tax=Pseudooceanicola pacificus TaxID=2676438 RepID=A0A844WA56_9RHOB|nr:TRAP transporter small permease subunit [Pseudooceanicola pacificus]MWB77793.1 TRAP transporter small permease subunit [Pseudooceanicola pacificus]
MRAIESVASRISGFIAMIGGLIIVLMMTQVSLDVAAKYILHKPIPSTLELVSAYYMVALVWLPLGAVTRDHEHLEVELFTQHLAPRKLAGVKVFGCVLGAVYAGILCFQGFEEALHQTEIGEVWETATFDIPVWGARWFFPLGTFLATVYLTLYAIDNFVFMSKGERILPDRSLKSAIETVVADADRAMGSPKSDDGAIGVGRGGGSAD